MPSCVLCKAPTERPGVACQTCCDERMRLEAHYDGRWYPAAEVPVKTGWLFALKLEEGVRIFPRFVLSKLRTRSLK